MTAEEKFKEHLQWFLDRIGKKVWRTNTCDCASCKRIYAEGLAIENREHAIHLRDIEAEFGQGRRYFDTKEERDAHESRRVLKKRIYTPGCFGDPAEHKSLNGLCEELGKLPRKTAHRIASHIMRYLENVDSAWRLRAHSKWFYTYGPTSIARQVQRRELCATDTLVRGYRDRAIESLEAVPNAEKCLTFAKTFVVGVHRNFCRQTISLQKML